MAPATSLPGPHIDLVPEMITFFGRWLRDDPCEHIGHRSGCSYATRPSPSRISQSVDGEWRYEDHGRHSG